LTRTETGTHKLWGKSRSIYAKCLIPRFLLNGFVHFSTDTIPLYFNDYDNTNEQQQQWRQQQQH